MQFNYIINCKSFLRLKLQNYMNFKSENSTTILAKVVQISAKKDIMFARCNNKVPDDFSSTPSAPTTTPYSNTLKNQIHVLKIELQTSNHCISILIKFQYCSS